ncbi:hypothetical protein GALMADRAFT_594168 [Galerina marginata CBS 339.88]|uniref:Uncharacterized protein n=1 Tax=Galerina marginata (strain CBS 339.88) TaxID=685588 RepID=A0A067T4I9_GALM3|nr:hypothetical protein GALMADRAFT_594168 [Galerina marginata CBS 339.88]
MKLSIAFTVISTIFLTAPVIATGNSVKFARDIANSAAHAAQNNDASEMLVPPQPNSCPNPGDSYDSTTGSCRSWAGPI